MNVKRNKVIIISYKDDIFDCIIYDGSGKKVVEAEFKNGKKSVLRLLDKNGDILEEAIYN